MKLKIAKDELEFDQKPTLNKNFWNDEKLNPEVKDAIMAVVESYLESTNLEIGIDNIDEIEFTGSLANYNYSKLSDVDIHLLFDFSKLSKDPVFMQELLSAKAIIWNTKHNVTLFGHEVELYITAAGTDHHSTGVYSVKNDEWLVKPVRDPKLSAELNLNKVKDKADKISKEIDMLVVKDELSLEKLERLKDKIKKMRISGLETGGEFSTENLAFKLLRRRGELNTLSALMQQAKDTELSLDEDMEWWKKRRKKDNKNYRELMGYVGGKGVFKRKYASKNIGYPKSVSRRKLRKMGPPYTVDPQMKLPKSGPPGVGSLEEAVLPNTVESVIDYLETGKPVKMNLDQRDLVRGSIKCLTKHTYEIKKVGSQYNIKFIGDLKRLNKFVDPSVKGNVMAGILNPMDCVLFGGNKNIGDVALADTIGDAISSGDLRSFEVADPPRVIKTKKTPKRVSKSGFIVLGNSQRFSFSKALSDLISSRGYDRKPIYIDGAPVAKLGSMPIDWISDDKKADKLTKILQDNKDKIGLVGLAFGDHRDGSSDTELVKLIRSIMPDVEIVWMGAPPLWKNDFNKGMNLKRSNNNKKIDEKSKSLDFTFIDPYKLIRKGQKLYYRDHVHLTPAGAKAILSRNVVAPKPSTKKAIGSVAAIAKGLNSEQRKNAAIIEKLFRAAGFSDRAIAAAIVNAKHESAGMHSYTVGDGGSSVGLFQLNRGSDKKPFWGLDPKITKQTREKYRKLAQDNNLNPKFWNTSLKLYKRGLLQDFVKDRLNAGDWRFNPEENTKGILSDFNIPRYKKADKDGKTFLELVEMFLTKIERAGTPLLSKRLKSAKEMFPDM